MVNKTYSLAKKWLFLNTWPSIRSQKPLVILRYRIQREDRKALTSSLLKRASLSTKKKGKSKTGAGRPISYGNDLDELNQWILEMRDLNLPVSNNLIQRIAIEVIQPSHPTFKASAGWLEKFKTKTFFVNATANISSTKAPGTIGGKA